MSKTSMPLSERVHNIETDVDDIKVNHAKLQERVHLGFDNVSDKLETINTNVTMISSQVTELVTLERDRELATLRRKWGLATKILGAISLTLMGGFIKWLLDKLLGH